MDPELKEAISRMEDNLRACNDIETLRYYALKTLKMLDESMEKGYKMANALAENSAILEEALRMISDRD